MNKTESIVGWIYLFVHMFALGYIVALLNIYVFPVFGFTLSDLHLNLLYYGISFLFLLCFLFHFMRSSFGELCAHKMDTLTSILICYFVYMISLYAVALFLNIFLDNLENPNDAAVTSMAKLNPNTMIVIGVLLAPIVEEVLFRGVVFGTIRKKSRVLAYIVSALLFAVYHLWEYMLTGFSWDLVLYLLQYLPAGIILCWCYERSKNIWGSVFLHMMINYVSITVSIG
jgi:hypothetical protein